METNQNKGPVSFELFCIEPDDVRDEASFIKALSFSKKLWNETNPEEECSNGKWMLKNPKLGINIKLKLVDTSAVITDYFESAFLLRAESSNFMELESFRLRLLKHLRETLKFQHVRILTDDVSTYIANEIYPRINHVENLLRRYLTLFFIQKVGLDWWETTATRAMLEKVKMRKNDRYNEFASLVDADVSLVDFDDLGELIYKQSSGFNNPDKVLQKLLSIETTEQLATLKSELQGNYTRYFKESFQNNQFEQKWKDLFKIRNKVAHQGTFYMSELQNGIRLCDSIIEIIQNAEFKINDLEFSIEEKEAIRSAAIKAFDDDNSTYLPGLRILDKIELPTKFNRAELKNIEEQELLQLLEEAEGKFYNAYVGLKWFVTVFLANMSYSIGTSYAMLNIMADKKIIEIYEVYTDNGFLIKAIKRVIS
jgi:hypothetical protein